MSFNHHENMQNIPVSLNSYRNSESKYVSSLYTSPKKEIIRNYSYNYGNRHYYSSGIKPAAMHNVKRPIYILNPYFIANQLTPNNIYNTKILSLLSNTMKTVNYNKQTINYNKNTNNFFGYEIKTQKTIVNNNININNNSPQIHLNQNIIKENSYEKKLNKNINYSYDTNSLKTYGIQNYYNYKLDYEQYTNSAKLTSEINNNKYDNYNIYQNNITKNNLDNQLYPETMVNSIINKNDNFNNILLNLKKNEEVKLDYNESKVKNEKQNTVSNIKLFNYNLNYDNIKISSYNNIEEPYNEDNPTLMDNKDIININNNINIKNNINNFNNINLNIININEKESKNVNNDNNVIINEKIFYYENEINKNTEKNTINNIEKETESTLEININKKLFDIFSEIKLEDLNQKEIKQYEIKFENKFNSNSNKNKGLDGNNIISNYLNSKKKRKSITDRNQKLKKEDEKININIQMDKKENVIDKKNNIENSNNSKIESDINVKNNKNDLKQTDKDNISIVKESQIRIKPQNNDFDNERSINNNSNNHNIKPTEQNKLNNNKEEKPNNKIKLKKRRRPVYKIPPSKKRSISQGRSLTFIHKYYDENFILEEESEDNSTDKEKKNINIDYITNDISKKIFQEVKVRKIKKSMILEKIKSEDNIIKYNK